MCTPQQRQVDIREPRQVQHKNHHHKFQMLLWTDHEKKAKERQEFEDDRRDSLKLKDRAGNATTSFYEWP